MLFKKSMMSIKEQRNIENALAAVEKNTASLDYIAIMAGIDMPSTESEVTVDEQEL